MTKKEIKSIARHAGRRAKKNLTEEQKEKLRRQVQNTPEMAAHIFRKGQPAPHRNLKGRPTGKTLYTMIREKLEEVVEEGGKTMLEVCASAYIRQMKKGSFVHHKEIMDRQDGKIPTRVANADGENLKMYVGMPIDGDEAP